MNQQNKNILIGLALVLVGGLIGYTVSERNHGAGILAGLSGQQSSAMRAGGDAAACNTAIQAAADLINANGGSYTAPGVLEAIAVANAACRGVRNPGSM